MNMRNACQEPARTMLERAVMTARAVDSSCLLLRPHTFIAVLQEDPAIIEWWRPCAGSQHVPTFTTSSGEQWPIRVCDDLYPSHQQKTLGAITRGLRNAPPRVAR